MENFPEYWKKFYNYTSVKASEKNINEEAINWLTNQLAEEYSKKGYIELTPKEALQIDDSVICRFYLKIGKNFTPSGAISPVEKYNDASWMYHSDFCFLNVRAISPVKEKTGKFIDALKLIPVIRANSIHLAPFFDCALDNIYAVSSLKVIMKEVLDEELLDAGVSGDEQLLLLVDAIHSLGKTLGFDLEPHTGQYSRIVLEHPEHFRWIKLSKTRDSLENNLTDIEMHSRECHDNIVKEVKEIVKSALSEHELAHIEDVSRGYDFLRGVHQEITDTLISLGYWTLPSHTWGGVGLPKFDFYYYDDNHPDFIYKDRKGQDHHEHSFGMLTPFRFYSNLKINDEPDCNHIPEKEDETIKFFQSIFPEIQRRYRFDYVRFDYVDHVFDACLFDAEEFPSEKLRASVMGDVQFSDNLFDPVFFDLNYFSKEDVNKFNIAVSDRMIPETIQDTITVAKGAATHTGAMAERMGTDIEEYSKLGFDLILGSEVVSSMTPKYLNETLTKVNKRIELNNQKNGSLSSILFAVDTHDSGHPLFWSLPLSEALGARGIALRHFLSRFSWAGKSRRPKYEVIGNQDLSFGLYEANNKSVSINWIGDKAYNKRYHSLENTYETFRELIYSSHIGPMHFYAEWGYWFIDREDGRRERLLCVAGLEEEFPSVMVYRLTAKKLKKLTRELGAEAVEPLKRIEGQKFTKNDLMNIVNQMGLSVYGDLIISRAEKMKHPLTLKPEYEAVRNIVINFRENYHFDNPVIMEIDLWNGTFLDAQRISGHEILINSLDRPGSRLFFIKEQ